MKKHVYIPIEQFFPAHETFLNILIQQLPVILSTRQHPFHFQSHADATYVDDIVGPLAEKEFATEFRQQSADFVAFLLDNADKVMNKPVDKRMARQAAETVQGKLVHAFMSARKFKKLLDLRNIGLVLVSADYSFLSRPIVLEAKKRNIPTLNIEHGFFASRSYPEAFREGVPVALPFASDYVAVNNPLEAHILDAIAQKADLAQRPVFLPLGAPVSAPSAGPADPKAARKLLSLDPSAKVLSLFGAWAEPHEPGSIFQMHLDEDAFYDFAFRCIQSLADPSLSVVIKLHPAFKVFNEPIGEYLEQKAESYGVSPKIHLDHFDAILAASDFVISSRNSSIIWQAIEARKPTACTPSASTLRIMKPETLNQTNELARSGLMRFILTESDFHGFIHDFGNPSAKAQYRDAIKAFMQKWAISPASPEAASQRIIEWIRQKTAIGITEEHRKISIIIPLFNKVEFTRLCVRALKQTTPEHLYELIIVDNASTDGTKDLLKTLNGNIKIIANEKNLGFAKACNQGAEAARGDYLLFLNNDTEPKSGWLEPLVDILDADESVAAVGSKLLYPDGTLQHAGVAIIDDRKLPDPLVARHIYCRCPADHPEANEMRTYQALTAACILIRKSSFDAANGFDEGYYNGYEDVDLCFKFQEMGLKLVYDPRSVVVHHESKSGPQRFVKVSENIRRLHGKWLGKIQPDVIVQTDGTIKDAFTGQIKAYRSPDSSAPEKSAAPQEPQKGLVSIVILTINELKYTRECVQSIQQHTPEPHEIIFIDNGSTDGTVKWLRKLAPKHNNYRLIENQKNLGFARGCNQGIEAACGEYILLLNNDTVVVKDWLSGMMEALNSAPNAGIVGPMTNSISGPQKVSKVDYASVKDLDVFAETFRTKNRHRRIPIRRIVGFCMLFKRSLVDEIGLLDESFGSGNFEDDDFCIRAALAGYQNLMAGDVFIHHYGSRSFIGNRINYGSMLYGNRKIFLKKWSAIDPKSPEGLRYLAFNAMEKANVFFQKGDLNEAVKMDLEAIRYTPKDLRPYLEMAQMLIQEKKFTEAMEALQQAPEDASGKKEALMGYCQEGLGEDVQALALADLALDKNPALAMAINLKGALAYKQGDKQNAENFCRQAIAADPSYGEPYTNLGVIKWSNQEHPAALDLVETGFILSPNLSELAEIYHSIASQTEELARAEKVFTEAGAIYPFNRTLSFLRIDILIRLQKHAESMEAVEQAMAQFGIDDGMLAAALEIREKVGPRQIPSNKKHSGISLCMIVKDEEKNIARCLMSVLNLVDEIIVVDTGSSDRTRQIARAFGARVFEKPWTGDFSEARNFSLSKASGKWLLILDADEVIAASDHGAIRRLTRQDAPKNGYSITTRNYTRPANVAGWQPNDGVYSAEEAGTGWFPGDKVRLFPNDSRIRFEGRVHELVEASMKRCNMAVIACDVPVHHYGMLDADKNVSKGEAYYRLGREKIEEGGPKAIYELAVQAGQLKKFDEAIELWRRFLNEKDIFNEALAYVNMGSAYLETGRYAEAIEACDKAINLDPDRAEAHFNGALAAFFSGDLDQAISRVNALMQKQPDHLQAAALSTAVHLILGDLEKAESDAAILKSKGIFSRDIATAYTEKLRAAGRSDWAEKLLAAADPIRLL